MALPLLIFFLNAGNLHAQHYRSLLENFRAGQLGKYIKDRQADTVTLVIHLPDGWEHKASTDDKWPNGKYIAMKQRDVETLHETCFMTDSNTILLARFVFDENGAVAENMVPWNGFSKYGYGIARTYYDEKGKDLSTEYFESACESGKLLPLHPQSRIDYYYRNDSLFKAVTTPISPEENFEIHNFYPDGSGYTIKWGGSDRYGSKTKRYKVSDFETWYQSVNWEKAIKDTLEKPLYRNYMSGYYIKDPAGRVIERGSFIFNDQREYLLSHIDPGSLQYRIIRDDRSLTYFFADDTSKLKAMQPWFQNMYDSLPSGIKNPSEKREFNSFGVSKIISYNSYQDLAPDTTFFSYFPDGRLNEINIVDMDDQWIEIKKRLKLKFIWEDGLPVRVEMDDPVNAMYPIVDFEYHFRKPKESQD